MRWKLAAISGLFEGYVDFGKFRSTLGTGNRIFLSFPSEKAMNSPCFILKNKSDLGFDTSFSPLVIHKRKTKFCLKFSSEKLGETYRGYRFFRRTNLNANILRRLIFGNIVWILSIAILFPGHILSNGLKMFEYTNYWFVNGEINKPPSKWFVTNICWICYKTGLFKWCKVSRVK